MWHDAVLGGANVGGPNQRAVPNHFFFPSTQRWEPPLASPDTLPPPSSLHFPPLPVPPRPRFPFGQHRHNRQPQIPQERPAQTTTSPPAIASTHNPFIHTPTTPRIPASTLRSASSGSSSLLSMFTPYHPYRLPQAGKASSSNFGSPTFNYRHAVRGGAPPFPNSPSASPPFPPSPSRIFTVDAMALTLPGPASAWALHHQTQSSPVMTSNKFINNTDPSSLTPLASNTSEWTRDLVPASGTEPTVTPVAASQLPVSILTGGEPHLDQSGRSSTGKPRKTHKRCNQGCLTCRIRHKVR